MTDSTTRVAALGDVELVKMLTVDAKNWSPDVLAAAEAEAQRRGLPIDEAFIPADSDGEVEAPQSTTLRISGRDIVCSHCSGERFFSRSVLLNTRGLTLVKLDWLNTAATALICRRCGLVQLFYPVPHDGSETT